jgi:hypothetical protein
MGKKEKKKYKRWAVDEENIHKIIDLPHGPFTNKPNKIKKNTIKQSKEYNNGKKVWDIVPSSKKEYAHCKCKSKNDNRHFDNYSASRNIRQQNRQGHCNYAQHNVVVYLLRSKVKIFAKERTSIEFWCKKLVYKISKFYYKNCTRMHRPVDFAWMGVRDTA